MPEIRSLNEKTGISTHGNNLTLPSGTAIAVENWKCVRDNIYTKIRGRIAYGSSLPAQNFSQLLQFQDRLVCHMANNTLYYDSDGAGTFTQITGSYAPPEANYKIQGLELQGNHYITTSNGIYKSDVLGGQYRATGAPKGLSFDLRIINSVNWMTTGMTVAYRIVWSIEDANNNIVDGAPSERQDVTNSVGVDRAVELRIYIPSSVTVNYYCKVYRTTQATGTPPEDFQLVYQAKPTAGQISARILQFNDILADDWRGASLYTNTTQEGIANANELPPLANTITTFKNFTFYGNIQNKQRLYTSLISAANLTPGTSTVTFSNGTDTIAFGFYQFATAIGGYITGAANNGAGLIRITTNAAHGLANEDCINIAGVAPAYMNGDWTVTAIGANTFDLQGSAFAAAWSSGGTIDKRINNLGAGVAGTASNGAPNLVRITTTKNHGLTSGDYVRIYDVGGTVESNGTWQVTAIAATTFDLVGSVYAVAWTAGGTVDLYEDYGATPRALLYKTANQGTDAQNIANTAQSLVRVLNLCTSNTFWDGYYNSTGTDPVGKMEFNAKSLGATAFYLVANSTTTGGCFSPTMPIAGVTTYSSTNDDFQHAVMWSKQDQPEAVPLINIKKIGSADDPVLKVVGLRDSLFVIKKKDGIIRLTGETETSFNWDEFDSSECLQKNSIVKGENAIYMMSASGYVKISDLGVEVIGRDNEKNDLKPIILPGYDNAGYGWYYDSEKAYKIATYLDQKSTSNDIVKEHNVFTLAWTQRKYGIYTNDTNVSLGLVVNDIEYTTPLTGNKLLKERKSLDITDYTLPDIADTITAIGVAAKSITLGTNIVIHDDAMVTQGALTKIVTSYDNAANLTLSSVTSLHTNVSLIVANCVNNGAGLIRVSTTIAHTLLSLNGITIAGVTGCVEANGNWIIEVINATTFDLYGSAFLNAYTGGPGSVTNAITIKPGIYSRLKYQIIHCGYPEYEKFFDKASFFFDNDETSISKLYIKTTTDADTSDITTTIDETLNSLWEGTWLGKFGDRDITDKSLILIPDEHSRGTHLYLDIVHSMPQQRIDLNGYSLIFDIIDSRYQT